MENYIGKICPFCKTEITAEDAITVCPACEIPHHEGCWEENDGCTTFGCGEQNQSSKTVNFSSLQGGYAAAANGQPAVVTSVAVETAANVCTNCGAELAEGQAFCTTCGTAAPAKVEEKKNLCTNCGAELSSGQEFCFRCGQKTSLVVDTGVSNAINQFNAGVQAQNKKKNSKLWIIIVAIVVVVVGAIIGIVAYNVVQNNKEQAVQSYLQKADKFYDEVLDSGVTMEDIGNEIFKSWKAYVQSSYYNGKRYYSVDSAVAAAMSYASSDITYVKNKNSTIESLYRDLLTVPDTSDQRLLEIKEVVKDVYEAYKDMYDCVLDPEGNYNTWSSEFGDVDTALADTLDDLDTLVN